MPVPDSIINNALDDLVDRLTAPSLGGSAVELPKLPYVFFYGDLGFLPAYGVVNKWGRAYAEDWEFPLSNVFGTYTGCIYVFPGFERNQDITQMTPYRYKGLVEVLLEIVVADAGSRSQYETLLEATCRDALSDLTLGGTVEGVAMQGRTRFRPTRPRLAKATVRLELEFNTNLIQEP